MADQQSEPRLVLEKTHPIQKRSKEKTHPESQGKNRTKQILTNLPFRCAPLQIKLDIPRTWRIHLFMQTFEDIYEVSFNEKMTCICEDYKLRKLACKHIYFIFTRIAQCEGLLYLYNKYYAAQLPNRAYQRLDEKMLKKLQYYVQSVDLNQMEKEECMICQDTSNRLFNPIVCQQCKKRFHPDCLEQWKRIKPNATCPHCRGQLSNQLKPLSKFKDLIIDE